MKLLPNSYVFTDEEKVKLMWRRNRMTMTVHKQPPLLEDLRNHSPEQIAELRLLLSMCAPLRADARRPGFFEVDGDTSVFYIFKYPTGTKVLLLGCGSAIASPKWRRAHATPRSPLTSLTTLQPRLFQCAPRRFRGAFYF